MSGVKNRLRKLHASLSRTLRAKGEHGLRARSKDLTTRFHVVNRQRHWTEHLPQFRENFLGYCEYRKVSLTPQQQKVAEIVQREKKCLVPSGNEVGKSWTASLLASWHYDCWHPGITIVTAPNLKQVQDIIFKELRLLRHGDPNFLRKAARLDHRPNHYIDGLTANSPTGYQGRHDASVMVIFDEAEDISPEFWNAAQTMTGKSEDFFIAIYNPTTTGSQAAVEENSGHWPICNLSALEHPNVKTKSIVVPNAVTYEAARSRLARWSRKIEASDAKETDIFFDGQWYRPGPAAEARVLGRRPTQSVDTVFSKDLWNKMLKTHYDIEDHWPVIIGADIARFGDDYTCLHTRKGFSALEHNSYNGYDNVAVAKLIDALCYKYNKNAQFKTCINVDETGVGSGVIDVLVSMGYENVNGVNSGNKSNYPTEYPNVRSELLFMLAEVAEKFLVDLSRLDKSILDDLHKQMMNIKYRLDTRGRRVADEKAMVKSRLGRSPDDLDAIALAYHSPTGCIERLS